MRSALAPRINRPPQTRGGRSRLRGIASVVRAAQGGCRRWLHDASRVAHASPKAHPSPRTTGRGSCGAPLSAPALRAAARHHPRGCQGPQILCAHGPWPCAHWHCASRTTPPCCRRAQPASQTLCLLRGALADASKLYSSRAKMRAAAPLGGRHITRARDRLDDQRFQGPAFLRRTAFLAPVPF